MKVKFNFDIEESEDESIVLVMNKAEDTEIKELFEWIMEFIKIDIKEEDSKWILKGGEFKSIGIILSIATAIGNKIVDMFLNDEYDKSMKKDEPTIYDANNNPILRPEKNGNELKIQRPSVFTTEDMKEIEEVVQKTHEKVT